MLAATLMFGTAGYVLFEHMTPFEAFYMTVITISTVGFSEIKPLSVYGRVITLINKRSRSAAAIFVGAAVSIPMARPSGPKSTIVPGSACAVGTLFPSGFLGKNRYVAIGRPLAKPSKACMPGKEQNREEISVPENLQAAFHIPIAGLPNAISDFQSLLPSMKGGCSMRSIWLVLIFAVVAGVFCMAVQARAADSKAVNDLVRKAESLYFNGKAREADELLKQAERDFELVMQGSDEEEKTRVKSLESKLNNIRKNIDRKLGGSSGGTTGTSTPPPTPSGAPAASSSGELPSYVASQLQNVGKYLDYAQKEVDGGNAGGARRQLSSADDQIAKIEERYGKYDAKDHPDMVALKSRKADIEAAVADMEGKKEEEIARAAEASEKAQAVSNEWIARLKPYAIGLGRPGHDPERYFVGSYTAEEEEMAKRTRIYTSVKAELAAYKKSGPGDGATDELKDIVKNLEYQIETFDESCASMAQMYLGEAEQKTKYLGQRVDEETKKIGSGNAPLPMSKDAFEDARRSLDSAAGLLGKDDPHVAALEKEYQSIVEKNRKVIQARISETRMIPDKFSGGEKGEIKKKAEAVLQAEFPGVEFLRTSVVSPDWKEESVVEWTDTTRTALRHRITRYVSAQVSGKLNGDTKLYTVYVGKNRRTDGSWEELQGHVMFTDPILEENVDK